MRQNNSAPPSVPTRPISTERLCPGPLHCRREAPADLPLPVSTLTCNQRPALLRSLPILPKPRPTGCTRLTTRAEQSQCDRVPSFPPSPPPPWRSQCLGDTIRSHPHQGFGDDHWGTETAPPDSVEHLEIATAPLLTVWLILLSKKIIAPTVPMSRLPRPEQSRLYQATVGTSRQAFQFTHQCTQAKDDFSVFTNHKKPMVISFG